jgi:hypothetical protein
MAAKQAFYSAGGAASDTLFTKQLHLAGALHDRAILAKSSTSMI